MQDKEDVFAMEVGRAFADRPIATVLLAAGVLVTLVFSLLIWPMAQFHGVDPVFGGAQPTWLASQTLRGDSDPCYGSTVWDRCFEELLPAPPPTATCRTLYRLYESDAHLYLLVSQRAGEYDDDGSLLIQGRLSSEEGALFMQALNAARDGINTDSTPSDDLSARQADALVRLAETALAHEPTAVAAGERYQVIVHVDADALPVDGDGLRSHIEDGPRVSAETSRRLACDCSRLSPEGRPLSPAPTVTVSLRDRHGAGLRRQHQRAGLAIDATTAVTRWAGERMDLEMAVSHLLPPAH